LPAKRANKPPIGQPEFRHEVGLTPEALVLGSRVDMPADSSHDAVAVNAKVVMLVEQPLDICR